MLGCRTHHIVAGSMLAVGLIATGAQAQPVYGQQDWSEATGSPGFNIQDSGTASRTPVTGWDDGVANEYAFYGVDEEPGFEELDIRVEEANGPSGSGDQYADMNISENLGPPNGDNDGGWFTGLGINNLDPAPESREDSELRISADVWAPEGNEYAFRLENDLGPANTDGGFYGFRGTGDGSWQTVGGVLSDANTAGSQDPHSENLRLFVSPVRFTQWDEEGGGTLRVDNVEFTAVPEPTSAALLGVAGLGLTVMRRRRRA